ncbi:MAG: hypothetical protein QXP81_09380 [Nitrososphaerota archaeon]
MIGKPILVTTNLSEAIQAMQEYTLKTGMYVKVETRQPTKGSSGPTYIVLAYDERCNLRAYVDATHQDLHVLAKAYLKMVQLGQTLQAATKLVMSYNAAKLLEELTLEKRAVKKMVVELIGKHPIYPFVKSVSGLGDIDALILIGNIDPHECVSTGRAKAIWGFVPKGPTWKGRPYLKGYGFFMAQRVVMKKYRDEIVFTYNGTVVRRYRRGQPGYAAAITSKSIFWLAALLVSHAAEIIRKAEFYEIPQHHPHIPPKPSPDAVPSEEILHMVREGVAAERWKDLQKR